MAAKRAETELPTPQYVEAYCRLDSVELWRAAQQGKAGIIWTDLDDQPIGMAKFRLIDGIELHFRYRLIESTHQSPISDENLLTLSQTSTNKKYFDCPGCGQMKGVVVFYRRTWMCAKCHSLSNRSALLAPAVRKSERFKEIKAMIGDGRPPRMRQERFDALRGEGDMLWQQLGGRTVTANRDYQYRVSTEFVFDAPAD